MDRGHDGQGRRRERQFRAAHLEGARTGAVEKLRDEVGLYVDPPAHAVVLSLDVQALDRTQPGPAHEEGTRRNHDRRLQAQRHDDPLRRPRLDGTVLGRNMQRHRHQEFIRFLNAIEAKAPAGKLVHVILDNYAAHKHPEVRQWLARA